MLGKCVSSDALTTICHRLGLLLKLLKLLIRHWGYLCLAVALGINSWMPPNGRAVVVLLRSAMWPLTRASRQ